MDDYFELSYIQRGHYIRTLLQRATELATSSKNVLNRYWSGVNPELFQFVNETCYLFQVMTDKVPFDPAKTVLNYSDPITKFSLDTIPSSSIYCDADQLAVALTNLASELVERLADDIGEETLYGWLEAMVHTDTYDRETLSYSTRNTAAGTLFYEFVDQLPIVSRRLRSANGLLTVIGKRPVHQGHDHDAYRFEDLKLCLPQPAERVLSH